MLGCICFRSGLVVRAAAAFAHGGMCHAQQGAGIASSSCIGPVDDTRQTEPRSDTRLTWQPPATSSWSSAAAAAPAAVAKSAAGITMCATPEATHSSIQNDQHDTVASASTTSSSEAHAASQAAAADPVINDICQVLEHMGFSPGKGCVIADGQAVLDIAVLVGDPLVQVAVEVKRQPSGPPSMPMYREQALAAVRHHMLKAHGWTSAQVWVADWTTLDGHDVNSKVRYLAAVLGHAVDSSQGGDGHVCGSGCNH
eukprot:jgi/Chrzof1/4188/Cz14g02080.t1